MCSYSLANSRNLKKTPPLRKKRFSARQVKLLENMFTCKCCCCCTASTPVCPSPIRRSEASRWRGTDFFGGNTTNNNNINNNNDNNKNNNNNNNNNNNKDRNSTRLALHMRDVRHSKGS